MGCGTSKTKGDGPSFLKGDPWDTVQKDRRPSNYFSFQPNDEVNEREYLLAEDDRKTQEKVEKHGIAACINEAIVKQRAKMLTLQIIMRFQEGLIARKRLTRMAFDRWRYMVMCRKTNVEPEPWSPRGSSKKRRIPTSALHISNSRLRRTSPSHSRLRLKSHPSNSRIKRAFVVDDSDYGDQISVGSKMDHDIKRVNKREMETLVLFKEDDLMRSLEIRRQEAEARGQKLDVKKLMSYGNNITRERVCCKNRSCVIS